ncbi:MAG: hypothetical protein F6K58_09985 [Symploca sp. SIO2E9]|nr:hypothetical protein [Symploca sp. SIO2E9]
MPKAKILQEGQSYTFRSYFEMSYEADEILAEFDYSFTTARLQLPKSTKQSDRLPYLQQQIEDVLPLVRLSSETARRETLVAPILLEVARFCQCQIRIEYPLTVNNWLKGNLDYFLHNHSSLLVIEAKKDDLSRGFTQLAVEMIALAQVEEPNILYGAVTIGDVWRFGKLDSQKRRITQDITLYRVPDDLEQLTQILISILG